MKKYIIIISGLLAFISLRSAFEDVPTTQAELGKRLFSDPILSGDRSISCASCHQPARAFADTGSISFGVNHKAGTRNSPSVMNLSSQRVFFWDGRAATLEEQALAPIENPVEMNLPVDMAIQRLNSDPLYRKYFQRIFNSEVNRQNLAIAIASFERTLETSESPFDIWKMSGNISLVNEKVRQGFMLFNGKAKCNRCHFGIDFSTNEFKNIGLFNAKGLNDSGRAMITHKPEDLGRFKVPGLRNVAITSPYMHNGKFKTLIEVVEFYNEPLKIVPNAINLDTILQKPMGLTTVEKESLVEFLKALTDKRFLNPTSGR